MFGHHSNLHGTFATKLHDPVGGMLGAVRRVIGSAALA